ncbi:hypothetical protein KGA66_25690 [Actinocrinis puniceicyclus]|uniref:Uncharacterized protein n=1 Tax=Actinocrinis puniceicyclus TaxID=977794 RepID=A0A8J8BFA6_9ACTN|nr:hypothetical protein [Actinocrinis puniceicyclus]MBS2966460.1 hypothetical protein [Actinocrinis puniceicyclus]
MFVWDYITPQVAEQAVSTPADAAVAFMAFMDAVIFDPWEFGRTAGQAVDRAKNLRTTGFGPAGLVTFLILEEERLLLVVQVQWAG